MSKAFLVGVATAAALAAVVAWRYLGQTPPVPAADVSTRAPSVASAPSPPAPPADVPASGPSHPVVSEPAAPPATDMATALAELFGRKALAAMFQTDDFAKRVVATVDNLGREQATSRLWPVNPTAGRFTVERHDGVETIGADNSLRYTPFVLLVETVDLREVVKLYTRFYPTFQRAYEELGFPSRYFNDRLVEVIDHLVATPDSEGPLEVRLPTSNSPIKPERPWVLYEFADPSLQRLSAGQRLLLRTGPVNQRRLERKLVELRGLIASSTKRP